MPTCMEVLHTTSLNFAQQRVSALLSGELQLADQTECVLFTNQKTCLRIGSLYSSVNAFKTKYTHTHLKKTCKTNDERFIYTIYIYIYV